MKLLQYLLPLTCASCYFIGWRGVALTLIVSLLIGLYSAIEIVKARVFSKSQLDTLNEAFDQKLNQHRDLISTLTLTTESLKDKLTMVQNAQANRGQLR